MSSKHPQYTPSPSSSILIGKTRKTLGMKKAKEKDKNMSSGNPSAADVDEALVVVEPVNIPRPRTRSERPAISAPDSLHSPQLYSSTSSTSRIGDLPTRLSGWFSHTFTSSSTDLPSLLAHATASPKSKSPSALLTVAKNGKGHLDKAMRYLLDSDATPDKCTDPIWLLGVQHPGYEPPLPALPNVVATSPTNSNNTISGSGSPGSGFRRSSASPPSFRSSTSSVASNELSTNSSSSKIPNPAANWPPVFYIDFTSRIWLTYRSQYPLPIKDGRLADLYDSGGNCDGSSSEHGFSAASPTIAKSRPWNWVGVISGEKIWTSDTGWGCMLRTGQSLLANALIHVHLGRDWRRPPYPVHTADYATYVQILTWFLDTPVQEAPFSVHRMALAGKELGTDIGQWFGPSVAAGAIKILVSSFLECGLAVSAASDSTLYQTHVFAASHGDMDIRSPRRRHGGISRTTWGDRPVLLLLGLRLGIEGVNPIYYDTIKLLYTFPQSVGIAGGRPSSSYYFVGSQADHLFYLDPHNPRPAIPLRSLPARAGATHAAAHEQREMGAVSDSERDDSARPQQQYRKQRPPYQQLDGRWRRSASTSASGSQAGSPRADVMDPRELARGGEDGDSTPNDSMLRGPDPIQLHYCTAYSAAELKTFHCERVRKMPMSGLDPSMLIGFLCRDEKDWWDFKKRVADLPRTIFSVQDELPTWPSDSDDSIGLESISEPDDMDLDGDGAVGVVDDDEGEEEEEGEVVELEGDVEEAEEVDSETFFDSSSRSASTSGDAGDDIEDDWVDPSLPSPTSTGRPRRFSKARQQQQLSPPPVPVKDISPSSSSSAAPPLSKTKSSSSKKSNSTFNNSVKTKKKKKQIPVPVPPVKLPTEQQSKEHYPFPVAPTDHPSPHRTASQDRDHSAGSAQNKHPGGITNEKRMHTARARDGGRTQSGGVKGIFPDD